MASLRSERASTGAPDPSLELLEPRQRLARALWDLADLERAASSRRSFRALAYRRAVWSLDDLSGQLTESQAEMREVSGIGPGIAALIDEFRSSGRIRALVRLRDSYPTDSNLLRRLPRMTPTLLRRLKSEVGIETIEDLRAAIRGESLDLQGVGEKTLSVWLERLGESDAGTPIFDAALYASRLGRHIARHTNSVVQVTGSIRRFDEMVDVVELLVIGGDDVLRFLGRSAVVAGCTWRGISDRTADPGWGGGGTRRGRRGGGDRSHRDDRARRALTRLANAGRDGCLAKSCN